MSDGLLIPVGIDAKDALAAAEALPDALERKMRAKKFGDFTQGYTSIEPGKVTQLDNKFADRRWAYELKLAQEAEKRKQAATEQTVVSSEKWLDLFGKKLGETLMSTIGPMAVVSRTINSMVDKVMSEGQVTRGVFGAQERLGMSPVDTRLVREMAALTKTATADEMQAMAESVNSKMRNIALGVSTEGVRGLQAFGFDQEKYLAGQQTALDIIKNASESYGQYGKSGKFSMEAQSAFGADWDKMRGVLAAGKKTLETDYTAAKYHLEDVVVPSSLAVVNLNRRLAGEAPVGDLMGGGGGGRIPQMLANVSSLQAMGGGDVLSAIARGPQERTADAAEAINDKMDNFLSGSTGFVGGFTPPAKLGR